MSDLEIVSILRSSRRNKGLLRLYRYYPQIEKMILTKGGCKQDAQDVFQETLIIFCKKVGDTAFQLTSSIDTYLYSVARLYWQNELRKSKSSRQIDFGVEMASDVEAEFHSVLEKEARIRSIEDVLGQVGQRCLDLLKAFYFKSMSMAEIARKMGFRSENVAKNQKYKCLEKARNLLLEQRG